MLGSAASLEIESIADVVYVDGMSYMRLRLSPESLPESLSIDMRVKCLT